MLSCGVFTYSAELLKNVPSFDVHICHTVHRIQRHSNLRHLDHSSNLRSVAKLGTDDIISQCVAYTGSVFE